MYNEDSVWSFCHALGHLVRTSFRDLDNMLLSFTDHRQSEVDDPVYEEVRGQHIDLKS